MELDLSLNDAVNAIVQQSAKLVCIQLPDGLKDKAGSIKEFLEEKTGADVFIWMGTCYGACDVPVVEGIDLMICFGHSEWRYLTTPLFVA